MRLPILLDTDLGSDVDDELALALLWGSPEVDVRGVSTTYGDTALRAGIVRRMADLVGREVCVLPGEATPLSGKDVWWAGIEGLAYGDVEPVPVPTGGEPSTGVRLLLDGTAESRLLAIGPLTSVAVALDHGLAVGGITIMGGDWTDASATEHNIASDVVAARRVLTSGSRVTVVGIEITRQVRFGEPEIERFAACGELGRIVATEMRAWMARWGEDFEVPHDPLTALALLEPGRFTFSEPGAVEVSDSGAVRRLGGEGTVRIATAVDVDAARASMADRIAAGLSVS